VPDGDAAGSHGSIAVLGRVDPRGFGLPRNGQWRDAQIPEADVLELGVELIADRASRRNRALRRRTF